MLLLGIAAKERQAKVAEPTDNPVERGLIVDHPTQHRCSIVRAGNRHIVEPVRPGRVKYSLNMDNVGRATFSFRRVHIRVPLSVQVCVPPMLLNGDEVRSMRKM
jgi:hypothetical protein